MQPTRSSFHTSHSSVLKSAARLQWALDSKFALADLLLHWQGQMLFAHTVATQSLDPAAVMSIARAHGLHWSGLLMQHVLQHKIVELLLWLIGNGCPWDLRTAASCAIDSVPMLRGIRSLQVEPWPVQLQDDLMWQAGLHNHTATMSWLHEQGTDWPHSFVRVQTIDLSIARIPSFDGSNSRRYVKCWPLAAVQLALSNGSSWGQWSCEELRESAGTIHSDSQRAEQLFAWAHRNGCPCTCEADRAAAAAAVAAAAKEELDARLWDPL
jgi:hypothetical protein